MVGPAGCGKTHLASVWQARTNGPLAAAAELEIDTLPTLLASGKAVAIDCADAVAGQSRREQALLHLFNLVREAEGHLLLTGRSMPARWGLGLADLHSRLVALPVVAVGPPDDGLLGALLIKLFADRQLRVGADVVAFLTTHMERSFAAARRVVAALDAAALAEGRPITLPLTRAVLAREAGARHSEE
jgi:chromosomal replication initiation ATPase DnaA